MDLLVRLLPKLNMFNNLNPTTRRQLGGGVTITLMTSAEAFITAPASIMSGLYIQMYGLSPGILGVIDVLVGLIMMPFEVYVMMNVDKLEAMLGGKRKVVIGLCILSMLPPTFLFCHPPSFITEAIIKVKTDIFSSMLESSGEQETQSEFYGEDNLAATLDPVCTTDVGYLSSPQMGFHGMPSDCEPVRTCIAQAVQARVMPQPFSNATPAPYYRDGIGFVVLMDGIENWLSKNGTKPNPDPWHRVAAEQTFLYVWRTLTLITMPVSSMFLGLATKVLFFQLVSTQEMRLAMTTFNEYYGALMSMVMNSLSLWLAKAHGEDKLWQVMFFTRISIIAACLAYGLSTLLKEPPPEAVELKTKNNAATTEDQGKPVRVDLGMNPLDVLADVRSVLRNPLTSYQIRQGFIGVASSAGASMGDASNLVQFVMHLENPAVLTSAVAIFLTPVNLAAYPLGYALMTRWEKNYVSAMLTCYKAVELFCLSFLSPFGLVVAYPILAVTHTIIGSARTMSSTAYMGDVLDYDTFRAGRNRMMTVSMIESIVLTRVSTLVGTFNGILITLSGYRINGDCECGCGVPCQMPYLRWSCPTDVGYACTRKLERANTPFFGHPARYAGCTIQNDYVESIIRFFYFYWPMCFLAIEAYYWWHYPFTNETRVLLSEQHKRRAAGLQTIDPITLEVSSIDRVERMDMFSDAEMKQILNGETASLVNRLGLKTCIYALVSLMCMVLGLLLSWLMPHPLHDPRRRYRWSRGTVNGNQWHQTLLRPQRFC